MYMYMYMYIYIYVYIYMCVCVVGPLDHRPQMAVVFSLFFGRFVLVFTAFCLYVTVRFYVRCAAPPSSFFLLLLPPSSLPDLICRLSIAVGLAGPQPARV